MAIIRRSQIEVPKKSMLKLHAGDMEIHLARHFNYRANLIVPNVYWGLGFRHECDLLIVSPAGWAREIEIKVTLSDLKADKNKRHCHGSPKIRQLYFAVPGYMLPAALEFIPEHAGCLGVCPECLKWQIVKVVKTAKINAQARKLTPQEIHKLGELAAMRIWSLKEVIYRLQREASRVPSTNLTK